MKNTSIRFTKTKLKNAHVPSTPFGLTNITYIDIKKEPRNIAPVIRMMVAVVSSIWNFYEIYYGF